MEQRDTQVLGRNGQSSSGKMGTAGFSRGEGVKGQEVQNKGADTEKMEEGELGEAREVGRQATSSFPAHAEEAGSLP